MTAHAPLRARPRWTANVRASAEDFVSAWRKPPRRRLAPWSAGRIAVWIAYFVVLVCFISWMLDVDTVRILGGGTGEHVVFFRYLTMLGASGYIFVLCAAAALACAAWRGRAASARARIGLTLLRQRAVYVFSVVAVSGLLSQIFKHLLGRARPKLMDQFGAWHFEFFSVKATLASMPSGHATTAFATAAALGYFLPRLRMPLLIVAVLVGLSRVFLDTHYMSDVFAGAELGMVSAVIIARAFAARRIAFGIVGGNAAVRGRGLCLAAWREFWQRRAA